jgi:hypothetical protein
MRAEARATKRLGAAKVDFHVSFHQGRHPAQAAPSGSEAIFVRG